MGGTQEAGKASIGDTTGAQEAAARCSRQMWTTEARAGSSQIQSWAIKRKVRGSFADWPVLGYRESAASHKDIQRWEKKGKEETKRGTRDEDGEGTEPSGNALLRVPSS